MTATADRPLPVVWCQHWSRRDGLVGHCAIGKFEGAPTVIQCRRECEIGRAAHFAPPPPAERLAHLATERRTTCGTCPHFAGDAQGGNAVMCRNCDCPQGRKSGKPKDLRTGICPYWPTLRGRPSLKPPAKGPPVEAAPASTAKPIAAKIAAREAKPRLEPKRPRVASTYRPRAQDPSLPTKLILRSHLSPGDILMMTATVRDLHQAHPGRYITDVDTSCRDLWQHNPHVTKLNPDEPGVRTVELKYPLVHQSNQVPYHFIHGYRLNLEDQLGIRIPAGPFHGDVHLTHQETHQWINQVQETFGHEGPFWLINAGGKFDYTAKWWNPAHAQAVVDHFRGRIQFVQVGESHHFHPPLEGVFNLIGKTNLRQFMRLMYHAAGVVCPVTFAMHLAAATPTRDGKLRPCVVIAGGREPVQWEMYPHHDFLHTVGKLDCCERGGCWRSRCQQVGDQDAKDVADKLCKRPVSVPMAVTINRKQLDSYAIPECMDMIRPERVIDAIEAWLEKPEPPSDPGPKGSTTPEPRVISLSGDHDVASGATELEDTAAPTEPDSLPPPETFAHTSPFNGCWPESFFAAAGGVNLYRRKVKTEADLRKLVAEHGTAQLLIMGNFVVERAGITSLCRELGINTVHGEDGFFPHYESLHTDPLGFCWESSLCRMTFRELSDNARSVARAAREGWLLVREYPSLPDTVKPPFVLWPVQLIGDRVNRFGANTPDWRPLIEHFRAMLPDEFQLVVKDHPRGSQYEALRTWAQKVPGVVMLPKSAPLSTLLRDCAGVAGANSTVLAEARVMFHKPTWAYARSWYTGHEELVIPLDATNKPRKGLPRQDWLAGTMRSERLDDYADWFLAQLLARQRTHKEAKADGPAFRQWLLRRSYAAWRDHGEAIFDPPIRNALSVHLPPARHRWPQRPDEALQLIRLLRERNVASYLEVGAKFGDTFRTIAVNLPQGSRVVAVDLPGGPWGKSGSREALQSTIDELVSLGFDAHVIWGDSHDPEVIEAVRALGPYDACLIDADHSYRSVKRDWETYSAMASMVAFHDIDADADPRNKTKRKPVEVPKLWRKIRNRGREYREIVGAKRGMGIGVIISPTPPHLGGHGDKTHLDAGALRWLRDNLGIRSMIDIGCGPGGMEGVAAELGIRWRGVDGDPKVARPSITLHDYASGPFGVEAVDLAWSVEFVEHVDERYQANYMQSFKSARYCFVTAAPPGKNGHHHVTLQGSRYWQDVFAGYGYEYLEEETQALRAVSTMARDFARDYGMLFRRSEAAATKLH